MRGSPRPCRCQVQMSLTHTPTPWPPALEALVIQKMQELPQGEARRTQASHMPSSCTCHPGPLGTGRTSLLPPCQGAPCKSVQQKMLARQPDVPMKQYLKFAYAHKYICGHRYIFNNSKPRGFNITSTHNYHPELTNVDGLSFLP